jgi:hypothetical protein
LPGHANSGPERGGVDQDFIHDVPDTSYRADTVFGSAFLLFMLHGSGEGRHSAGNSHLQTVIGHFEICFHLPIRVSRYIAIESILGLLFLGCDHFASMQLRDKPGSV